MKRFRKSKQFHMKSVYTGIVLFLLFVVLFFLGIRIMSNGNSDREQQALESAMERNIMHCYATEGFYPPSLDYMESHYGLTYDSKEFIVDYQPIGNNIYPNYTIIRKGRK